MKVLLVNGSPHKEKCTYTALMEVSSALNENGIDTDLFWIGNQPLSGCIACKTCVKKHACVFDDKVNEFLDLAGDYDGFVFGTPVHWGGATGAITSSLALRLTNNFHNELVRAMVESTLNRMCVNPMQDKINGIRAMALEAQEEFDAAKQDISKPKAGSRALIKLRGELIRLYGMQQDLANVAQSDSERALTGGLLTDLEQISKQAHEAVNFTHVPLEQLATMQ